MKEEKKESPISVLWGWGKAYHGKFIGSIILAVLGVACQMVPYFCVAHIVTMMLSGEQNFSRYVTVGIRYTVVVLFISCKVYIYVVYSLSGWLPLCSIAAICSVVLNSYALDLRPCNDKFHISLYVLT